MWSEHPMKIFIDIIAVSIKIQKQQKHASSSTIPNPFNILKSHFVSGTYCSHKSNYILAKSRPSNILRSPRLASCIASPIETDCSWYRFEIVKYLWITNYRVKLVNHDFNIVEGLIHQLIKRLVVFSSFWNNTNTFNCLKHDVDKKNDLEVNMWNKKQENM